MSDPESPIHPIFYDEDRRRWYWILRLSLVGLLLAFLALVCFFVSVFALPLLPHNALPKARAARDFGNPNPVDRVVADRQQAQLQFAQARDRRLLAHAIEQEKTARKRNGPPRGTSSPIVAGYYVNWEATSHASLWHHVDEITHFFPEWLHVGPDGETLHDGRVPEDRREVEPFVRAHNLPILPVVNNYWSLHPDTDDGYWDKQAAHSLISIPDHRRRFIAALKAFLIARKWQGVNIDLEQIASGDRDSLTEFMRELYAALHPAGLLVTEDISPDEPAYDVERLALWNDYLIPMLYDEHSPGDSAGSIASIAWTQVQLRALFARVPADKIILGLGNYAYDWKKGEQSAASLTYQAAVIQARESPDPDDPSIARIQIDPKSLNPFYRYYDESGAEHSVWMLDATTAYNQWKIARPFAPRGMALWYMGAEDPSLWTILGRSRIAADNGPRIDDGVLDSIRYGPQSEVDFEGEGELLNVLSAPSDGHRTVRRDAKTGLITAETYQSYPSAYVVRRYGAKPGRVVLTFDDGPDPTYTPQILDILKREGVKATFFVIGAQAESHPGLVARMWDEGHEIGNHTFTHPDLTQTGDERTLLEINMTQRIIESIIGRKTILFRPPYAVDVEPRTGDELKPIILASRLNFISVGEMNDPQDWNLIRKGPHGVPHVLTADDIVRSVWESRNDGSVILLHDGGGDRAATVAALPRIIEQFKAAGYRFSSLAELRGVSRDVLFPPITGREEVLVGIDHWVFEISYLIQRLLITLFTLSILLGITRQVWIAGLALLQRQRERAQERAFSLLEGPAPDAQPLVSVLIAAYNEEKVIERTIRTILNSRYSPLEVIAIDDGSRDNTFEVVSTAFAAEARVTCIHQENGGKSSALNRGLRIAHGEIVVALDADTLFVSDTISRLVRHFSDPTVGAVSGNVRVGNVNNILTRWQALEYITSQNFDRRAYDLLNCITVVPGAIGAWRKAAVEAVGGYTHETLAEDTDLTWKILRAGWHIHNDSRAIAYTEAPETLPYLARQRFRWAFGTLQNLWKHRGSLFRHGTFGWIALPSLWLYQILFPAISPIMDLTVVWALIAGSFGFVVFYYALMVGVEFVGAALALSMDRGDWRLLPWLFLQRLVYRQMMYYVIIKSLLAAVHGGAVGWNKFERRGTVRLDPAPPLDSEQDSVRPTT